MTRTDASGSDPDWRVLAWLEKPNGAPAFVDVDVERGWGQAEARRARVLPLADEDAKAYENFLLARRMPEDVDADIRDAAVGVALSRAADVPLAIAEAALDVASLAADLAERGNPNLRGDAATAALLSEAAVRATANLVEINLATREGDERIERARELVEMSRRISRRVLEPEPN
jgi:formiminotetrahydrofolate cyclodeaminase